MAEQVNDRRRGDRSIDDGATGAVGWTPAPVDYPPVLVWPPRPVSLLRWLPSFLFPFNALYLVVAAATWWLATPSTATLASLRPGWIGVVWIGLVLVRNLVLVAVAYGLTHWWLVVRRSQGERWRFNRSWPPGARSGRTFGSQTNENVFWTLASAVPIATAFEVTILWFLASGDAPWLAWSDHPVWFVVLFPALALFREVHFYAIHRLIHWPPLYRSIHRLHHRNTNPGPWSGLSMHPVEHVLYFSALAIHLVVPSHPLHVLATAASLLLAPIPGHSGVERMELGKMQIATNGYAHYLHHKLFVVNYADGVLPLDRWFGSFHDGSADADRRLRERRAARAKPTS